MLLELNYKQLLDVCRNIIDVLAHIGRHLTILVTEIQRNNLTLFEPFPILNATLAATPMFQDANILRLHWVPKRALLHFTAHPYRLANRPLPS
jgi:hypothetical protein